MTSSPPPSSPPPSLGSWLRPVALILACLVLGFVGGWILRGDDGVVTVLETGANVTAPTTTAAKTDGPPSTTGTTTAPPATTAAAPLPSRAELGVAVLNGTGVAGLAGQTAAKAESLGYRGVVAGDAPATTAATTVYFAGEDNRGAAERLGRDLEFETVAPLVAGGPIATAATQVAPDADLVVVLGP